MEDKTGRDRPKRSSIPRRLKILVVEDDPEIASLIADILEANADVHAVSTVDDATRFLATPPRRRLDAVIVDCLLPAPGAVTAPLGVGLVATIHEKHPSMPIIVITGATAAEELIVASFRGGARDFLRKPFTLDQLREAVTRVVPAAKAAPLGRGAAAGVARVVAFLDAHVGEPVSLDALARLAGMSRSRLSRSFHAIMGVLLRKYIHHLRLERAQRLLLASPDTPLSQVATDAGYYDLPHFDKAFRQRFGMSPSQFRLRQALEPKTRPRSPHGRKSA
jgi:AraC-like DNA-binding protein/CheY-like chemotaxis protein